MKRTLVFLFSMISLLFANVSETRSQWGGTAIPWSPLDFSSHWFQCFAANDSNLFAGSDSGVFVTSDNGDTWRSASSGLTHMNVSALAVSSTNVYAGTDWGVFRSTNNGASWTRANIGLYTKVYGLATIGSALFAATLPGGVSESTDSGANWKAMNAGLTCLDVSALVATSTELFGSAKLFVGTRLGVFVSQNEGKSWKSVNTGLMATTSIGDSTVKSLAVCGNKVYVGCSYDYENNLRSACYVSEDHGNSWTPIGGGGDALAVSDSNVFAADFSNGISSFSNNFKFLKVLSGQYSDFRNSPNYVRSLIVKGPYLFAGSDRAVFRFKISALTPSSDITSIPSQHVMLSIFPNPSIESTTLLLSSPESGPAQITIVNLLGTEVIRLFDGVLEAGEHTFTWDARGLPGGMYWCQVRMNGHVERVGMVVE